MDPPTSSNAALASAAQAERPADQLTVSLNILSPSPVVNAGGPLTLPDLPASTSIAGVKDRIRQALPFKPANDQQRLIYKGRSLQADDETLLQLIGEDTIKEYNRQTFHLVLRGIPDAPPPAAAPAAQPAARGRSPAADHRSLLANGPGRAQSPHNAMLRGLQSAPARRTASSQSPLAGLAIPNPPNFTPQQVQQMQTQLQQTLSGWSNGLQRDAVSRAMSNYQIQQNQSARAAMGMHGIGDQGIIPPGFNMGDPSRGRVSPGLPYTRTTVRDSTLPDGQTFRVTNTETWTPLNHGEVQNIIRGADAGQATQAMTSAMQRSESPAPFGHGSGAASVGVTTPFYPTMGSRAGSRMGTPDPASRSVSGGSANTAVNHIHRLSPPSAPEVYILSSPQGPRALLINNNADTYYSPNRQYTPAPTATLSSRLRPQAAAPWSPVTIPVPQTGSARVPSPPAGTPVQQQQPQQPAPAQAQHPPQGAQQQQQQQMPAGMPPIVPGHGHGNALMAPAFAQAGQHLWLLLRLGFFIWWMTYSNPSWTRWFTVIAIAITIFIVNTGILNGVFNQAGGVVREHVDQLLAQPRHEDQVPAGGAAVPAGAPQQQADPAQIAARLVAQRRQANANWLSDLARRLERAGLLFLASIAPGVAERHIAQLEAEERARELAAQREREQAEAAAAAAAAAASQGEEQGGEPGDGEQAGPATAAAGTGTEQQQQPLVEAN